MREKLVKLLVVSLIAFVFFYITNPIPITVYLVVFDLTLLAITVTYFKKVNHRFLWGVLACGVCVSVAYCLVRLLTDSISSYSLQNRSGAFYVVLFFTIALCLVMLVVNTIFTCLDKPANNDSKGVSYAKPSDIDEKEFIKERKYDLARLEEYLSFDNVVGINGQWGSGKTTIVKEFFSRHEEEVHCIKVDLLTCNEGELEIFLIDQLDKILERNHVYSSNSRKIKAAFSGQKYLETIRKFLWGDNDTKTTLLGNYVKDVEKLGKPIVVSIEDLDRLHDSKVIKELLDFTQRLSCDSIRIIYEYDADKLEKVGIDRDYLEKYIPYVVNLSPVSFSILLDFFAAKGQPIPRDDYRFLITEQYSEKYVDTLLGMHIGGSFDYKNPSVRSVEVFLNETKKYINKQELNPQENKRVIISFFFMKHLLNDIYDELVFQDDCLNEMKLESPYTHKRYTVQELFDEKRREKERIKNGQEAGDIAEELLGDGKEWSRESRIKELNKTKMILLMMMGYSLKTMDENTLKNRAIDDCTDLRKKTKMRYDRNYQETEQEKNNRYRNEKVSTLIRNLHANGLSEYTNEEAFAKDYIETVLYADNMKMAAKEFFHRAYYEDFAKRTGTVFKIGINYLVPLAKAVEVYTEKYIPVEKKKIVWELFLKYIYEVDEEKFRELSLDYISFCYHIELEEKSVYLRQIREFSRMKICGNLIGEKIYISFLEKYVYAGRRLGYYNFDYDNIFEYLNDQEERKAIGIRLITGTLEDVIQKIIETKEMRGVSSTEKMEIEAVEAFLRKNSEILKC